MNQWKKALAIVAFTAASLPLNAQWGNNQELTLTPRRTRDYDDRRETGYCVIRVRVDIEADIVLDGNRMYVKWYGGQPSRDEGTECSQTIPDSRDLRSFEFKGIDGRGEVRLERDPRRDGQALVKIRDPRGGAEGYTFRLSWSGRPGSGDWNSGGGGGWTGGGGGGWGGSGGGASGTTRGSGRMRQEGVSPDPTYEEMRVDFTGSQFKIELRGRNTFVNLAGEYRRSGNRYDLDIRDGFRAAGASGRGELYLRGNQVDRFRADGRTNRNNRRFEIEFNQSGWGGGGWGGGGGWNNTVNSSTGGRGSFYVGNGRAQDVSEARVEVRSNGEAMVEMRTAGTVSFYGTVTDSRSDEITVRINRFVRTDAEGEAKIRFRGSGYRDIETIEVRGRTRTGNDFRGDFRR